MKRIKTKTYLFIISFMMTSCILIGFLGACFAYENIVKTAFGEYKKAIEINENGIRILDFELNIK